MPVQCPHIPPCPPCMNDVCSDIRSLAGTRGSAIRNLLLLGGVVSVVVGVVGVFVVFVIVEGWRLGDLLREEMVIFVVERMGVFVVVGSVVFCVIVVEGLGLVVVVVCWLSSILFVVVVDCPCRLRGCC